MTSDLATYGVGPDAPESPWGKANPMRGINHVDAATAFVAEYPVGSFLSQDKFDDWAQRHGLLNVPTGAPKRSDAWMAHLQRRHHLRYGINQAASHPRMGTPFVIETVREGQLEVRTPQLAISKNKFLQRLESLCDTKRRQLAYLMQSADWSDLPPQDRIVAETIHDDIEMFQEKIEVESRHLNMKFSKLEAKLKRAVERGEIRPKNGGVKEIISAAHADTLDDVD